MATNAFSGVSSSFSRGDSTSNESFTAIPEIKSYTSSGIDAAEIGVTSIDSSLGFREFITGFKDPGTVTLTINFTRDGYDDFLADVNANTARNYRLILGDTNATQFDFLARVSNLGDPEVNPDDAVTFTVTLRKSGATTLTS